MNKANNITAQTPQTSGTHKPDAQDFTFEAPGLPAISLEIIRILLAGIMAVFGVSRRDWQAQRERAWRVRGSVAEARLHVDTLLNNKNVIDAWGGESSMPWGRQMLGLWNHVRPKSRERDNPHAARVRYSSVPRVWKAGSGHFLQSAGRSYAGTGDSAARDDTLICAPP